MGRQADPQACLQNLSIEPSHHPDCYNRYHLVLLLLLSLRSEKRQDISQKSINIAHGIFRSLKWESSSTPITALAMYCTVNVLFQKN